MTDIELPVTRQGNDPADWQDDPRAKAEMERRVAEGVEAAKKEAADLKPTTQALLQNVTEDSVALAFTEEYEGQFVYIHGRGLWHCWDGKRWAPDTTSTVRNRIRTLARIKNIEGAVTPSKASFVTGVEDHLKAEPKFARVLTEFDQDNYLLNCANGTYDLRTGECKPHDPRDNITKLTDIEPSRVGGDRFLRFLKEVLVTGGDNPEPDHDMIAFVQRALGSCLSGAIEGHWFMFWSGQGRNGKNTLGDAVLDAMGDYARTVPSSTLMSQKNQPHATEMMNMRGMRLVVSSEIESGSRWAESKIKELTGDTYLNGHYMRQDWISFPRTHKHLIYGNHRPQLSNIDPAMQSRLKIVPFRACFEGREDPSLPSDLAKECGYILFWLMEGHRNWLEAGKKIGSCKSIEAEASDYYSSQATVDNWIAERCEKVPGDKRAWSSCPTATTLYMDYSEWKNSRNETPVGQTRFGEELGRRYTKGRSNGLRYRGIKLRNPYGQKGAELVDY